jgi:hypothetical protein
LPNVAEQAVLDALVVRLITAEEASRWNEEIIQGHYLKNANLVGEQLRYVAEYQATWVALLGWSAATFHLKGRDAWLGWSVEQRRTRRPLVAQNSRFLILVDRHQLPNLASRALALCCHRLSEDWLARYGHPIVAVESFVDAQITFGTAYKASGWTMLGGTAGYARSAQDFYERHGRPKQLWVRALDPEGTAALKAPALPARLAAYEVKAAPRCRAPAPRLPSLLDRLPRVKDPRKRRGLWHPWRSVLGILGLAKLAGVAGAQRPIANFAKRLTQPQRRQLGCRRAPKTGRYGVPGQTTFFRALAKVDYLSFERVMLDWQDDWLGPADPNELVVFDGKTLVNAGGQVMVTAVGVSSGRVYGLEPVRPKDQLEPEDRPEVPPPPPASVAATTPALPVAPAPSPAQVPVSADSSTPSSRTPPAPALSNQPAPPAPAPQSAQTKAAPAQAAKAKKENEIPAARRLLARAHLAGQLVAADALHTQHQTDAQIVLGCGADYLFTIKANQEGLLKTAQTLVPSAFFPSGQGAATGTDRQDRRDQPGPPRDPRVGDSLDPTHRTGPVGRSPGRPSGPPSHRQGWPD